MGEELVSFTTRIGKRQRKRLLEICAATGAEVSGSELARLALDLLFAQLEVCPAMLPGYDPLMDKAARRKEALLRKRGICKTDGDL